MSRIHIDFAPRRAVPPVGLALLAALTLALAAGGYRYARLNESRRQLDQDATTASAQRAMHESDRPASPMTMAPERRLAIATAITELNIHWPALLDAVEHSKPPDALLLRIEPRTKDRALLITALAPDAGTLVDFMDALATSAPFFKVTPQAQETSVDVGTPGLQGSFTAFWQDEQDRERPTP